MLNRAGGPVLGCEMAVDASGEVLARGNMVMEGYWDQPEATATAIVDGLFHTGDGGSIDDTNYVTIVDRKKDVIISGGENVQLDRGRGRDLPASRRHRGGRDRHPRREVGRARDGARRDVARLASSPRTR